MFYLLVSFTNISLFSSIYTCLFPPQHIYVAINKKMTWHSMSVSHAVSLLESAQQTERWMYNSSSNMIKNLYHFC